MKDGPTRVRYNDTCSRWK